MQTVLAGYAKDVQEAYGVTLAGRVGVNTGPVVLLLDDAPVEERFNALGDTVNTAARLQSEAGTGGVAVFTVSRSALKRSSTGASSSSSTTGPVFTPTRPASVTPYASCTGLFA